MTSLIILSTFGVLLQQTTAGTSESSVRVAEKAAKYVMEQAIPENGGYKWNTTWPNVAGSYDRPTEVAHIGMFFIKLHEETGNIRTLVRGV